MLYRIIFLFWNKCKILMHITTGQVLVLICYFYGKELEKNVNRLEGLKGDHSVVLVFCDVNIFRLWTPGLALITFISKI